MDSQRDVSRNRPRTSAALRPFAAGKDGLDPAERVAYMFVARKQEVAAGGR